jgi:hypothetical protein
MNIDDIEGSRPSKKKQENVKTRNVLNVADIEGAKPKVSNEKMLRQRTSYNSLDYRDVTHNYFKSSRSVNPLNPVYDH